MTRRSVESPGYASALFTCYGVFINTGIGRATFSLIFLALDIAQR